MTPSEWLATVICPLPANPSPLLEKFLTSCDKDLSTELTRRAEIILAAIFPVKGLMDSSWAEERRSEAVKLYYRVLEKMCRAESHVLGSNNLTCLLSNERFHRCMLTCSAELVLATHKAVTMLFPAAMEKTGITAFDLSKIIEGFVRHEETIPRELRRHLNSLEERLLECLVWERGSSMYNSLIVAKQSLACEINHLGLLADPMPSLDSIVQHIGFSDQGISPVLSSKKDDAINLPSDETRSPKRQCAFRGILVERNLLTSPTKDRMPAKSKLQSPILKSTFSSPTRPMPGVVGDTCAETGINVFFGKINKLAALRINGIVERLQQPHHHMRDSVYNLFQQTLSQKTSLFFNRHIDQIILCCFYGIAKILKVNLTFKEIICNYRKQPQCKPQVFRNVFVNWPSGHPNLKVGQDQVDIITFYNEIFIPTTKPLLVAVGSPPHATASSNKPSKSSSFKEDHRPASPLVQTFPSLPDMSPRKVSTSHNVYISPLRSSKVDALVSHSSKSYYACVGESTHAYQSPSKDLTDINYRLNGNRKAKGALNFDDVDVGLVSDSLVAKSLNLENGAHGSCSAAQLKLDQPQT